MRNLPRISPAAQRIIVVLLAAATFLLTLGKRDIVTSHEARVAQTARIMAASGSPWDAHKVAVPVVHLVVIDGMKQLRPDLDHGMMQVNPWLVPVMNDKIRLQKPPLPYWCAAITFRIFGVGEGWARLVPALLGVVGALLMYELASMILGRRAGFIAAAGWLTTGHFIVDGYRKAMADPYLAFFTLLAICAWIGIAKKNRHAGLLLILFYLSLALGFLAKGPVIFLTVGFALVGYHLFYRARMGSLAMHLLGVGLFFLIASPWFVYCLHHIPHAWDLWRYESVGEVSGENVEKARAWWAYVGYAFEVSLPWTPLWIGAIVIAFVHGRRGIFSPRGRRRMIAIAWYAMTLVFFSCLPVKKSAYLLPAMPAQTLMITDALLILLAFAKRRALAPSPLAGEGRGEGEMPRLSRSHLDAKSATLTPHPNPLPEYRAKEPEAFRGMPGVLATAQALIGVGIAAGTTVLLMHAQHDRTLGIVCGSASIVLCLFALIPIIKRNASAWLATQVIAYAALTVVVLGFALANEQNTRSAKPFAHALAAYLPTQNLPLMVHWLPEEVSFYLPLNIPAAGDSPYALMVVDHSAKDPPETPQWFSQMMGDVRVIDSRQIDLHAPDGHGRWKLFELTMDRRQFATTE